MRLWKQHRELYIDGQDMSGFDMDISVTKPSSDPLEFDAKLWNLTDATWDRFDKNSKLSITLGWANGIQQNVIYGNVDKLKASVNGSDIEYRLQGQDVTAEAVLNRISNSWADASPSVIVEEIAASLGLGATVDPVGQSIPGNWAMTTDRKVKDWLDELLEYAAELTGVKWEWFAEQGRLFFVERSTTVGEAPELSFDGLLLNIGKKSNNDSEDDETRLEFTAMLDPRIRKGAEVVINTDRFDGVYRVENYEYASSTVSGDHTVTADVTLADDAEEYDPTPDVVEFPGYNPV